MEFPIAAFACGSLLLPFAVVGATFGWIAYAQSRDSRRWIETAGLLGLTPDPFHAGKHRDGPFHPGHASYLQPLRGVRGGVPVVVGTRVVIVGSGKNRSKRYYTFVRAELPARLGIGLSVRPTGVVGTLFQALVGSSDLQVGHPQLDSLYDIRAVDTAAAIRLLMTPYVGQALLAFGGRAFRPGIDEDAVISETTGRVTDATMLAIALDATVDLAHRVASARSAVATDLDHAMAGPWRAVAAKLGLELDAGRARLSGRLEGVAVEARVQMQAGERSTSFEASFDRRLGVDLALTRQGSLTGLATFLGAQDIQVGDALFDGRFVVKGRPVDAVRALLTPEVRAHLVAIQDQVTELTVHDDRLVARVAWMVVEPAWVEGGLRSVALAAAALTGTRVPSLGPFRG